MRRITRRDILELGDNIGPYTDVPAPDFNREAKNRAWVFDIHDMVHPGDSSLAVVAGKPVEIGASLGGLGMAARGCLVVTRS